MLDVRKSVLPCGEPGPLVKSLGMKSDPEGVRARQEVGSYSAGSWSCASMDCGAVAAGGRPPPPPVRPMDRLRGGMAGMRLLWSTSVVSRASASSDPVNVASERFSSSSSSSSSTSSSSSGDSDPDEDRPAAGGGATGRPAALRSVVHWRAAWGRCCCLAWCPPAEGGGGGSDEYCCLRAGGAKIQGRKPRGGSGGESMVAPHGPDSGASDAALLWGVAGVADRLGGGPEA